MVGRDLRVLSVLLLASGCAVGAPRPAADSPTAPVRPAILSRFGDSRAAGWTSRRHAGVDIRVPIGTSVLAAADGTVLRTGQNALAGKLIVVGHAPDLATVYYHLSEISVTPGRTVRRGEVIGRTGMTGNATTPHLHFGVCRRAAGQCGSRIQDGWDDPARYWGERQACVVPRQPAPTSPARLGFPVPCTG